VCLFIHARFRFLPVLHQVRMWVLARRIACVNIAAVAGS